MDEVAETLGDDRSTVIRYLNKLVKVGLLRRSKLNRENGDVGTDSDIYAFERPDHRFRMRDGTLYGDGVAWDPVSGRSSDSRRLTRVPARRLYAFAWQDDHGTESFYGDA